MRATLNTLRVLAAGACLIWASIPAFSQALPAPASRIVQPIDAALTVRLKGSVPAGAAAQFDQGAVDPSFKLTHITLELNSSAQQQKDLEQLLKDQQDPSSARYHKWLTPEEYAGRFGLSPADIASLTGWLTQQGFTVVYVARARNYIAFDGTAAQVQSAFQTEIHNFAIAGERHFANVSDPAVPAALGDVVRRIGGLHDFLPKPMLKDAPALSNPDNSPATSQVLTMTPSLFASLYDVAPLYNAGFTGAGQSIVIVGQSEPEFADVAKFRSRFNLPASVPQAILGGTDPGTQSITSGVVREQNLDLEWAGAVAPGASLIYVYSTSADGSLAYAIDNDLAPVMSESFGLCEAESNQSLMEPHLQAGASMGITVLVSSGDSGAAACDPDFTSGVVAKKGLAVSYPASSPEVTAVGGTAFTLASSAAYVPESAWNDTSFLGDAVIGLAAGGGGASAIFPKPAWQTGPGVPSDNFRDVPDVALAASPVVDPYSTTNNGQIILEGGTSASAPSMAGIVALLNQYLAANGTIAQPGLGVINSMLYQFSQTSPGSFHDIAIGGNQVPCQLGTPNCTNATIGYPAATGYDQATGLGSLDVNNLALYWSSAPVIGFSATSLTFAAQVVGTTSAAQTVTLTNSGNSPLGIAGITASGDFAQTNTCGASLVVAASCTISVSYKPTVLGPETGAISIAEASPGTPLAIALSGTATSAVSLSPASLTFAPQLINTISAAQTVMLTNAGPTALVINSIQTGSPFGLTNNCGASVAPAASCAISVTFKPLSNGSQTGVIVISDSAVGSPQTLNLTGTGYSAVSFSPSSLAFGSQPAGVASASQTFTLTNNGVVPLNISGIQASTASGFSQTNNCGASVPVAGSCTISVTFKPLALGLQFGNVVFTDNEFDSPQIFSLSGTGVSTVSLSPPSLTFAAQLVNTPSAPQVITLNNAGNAALVMSGITATGDFAQTNTCGASVPAAGSCAISVTSRPTATGIRIGAISVADSAIGSPQSVSLSGSGFSSVFLSSSGGVFSPQLVGTVSAPQSSVLTNQGSTALNITGIALTGTNSADFAETNNCPASLAPQAACTISMTLQPTQVGTLRAAIAITDSATDSPQTISLTGQGMDFSFTGVSGGATTAAVAAGQTASYNLQVNPTGYSGSLVMSCSGAPIGAVCTVVPATLAVNGLVAAFQVSVTTTARSFQPPRAFHRQQPRWPRPAIYVEALLLLALLLAARVFKLDGPPSIRLWTGAAVALICVSTLLAACGGGSTQSAATTTSTTSTPSSTNPGTPAGTYILQVTGTQATASRSVTLTLTVN